MYGLKTHTIQAIQSVFEKYPQVQKAILYGSRAKGTFRNGSDIDLTLVGGNDLNVSLLLKIENALEELLLPYKIDLSIFSKIENQELIDHINRIGIVFYEKKMSQWKEIQLRDISSDISYGYTASAERENTGTKFLRITDITSGRINWETVPYCKISDKDFQKYKLKTGDIVIARTGATTGFNAIMKQDINAVYASYLIRFQIDKTKANPFFVGYVLQSNNFQEYVTAIAGGSAQPGANAQQLADFGFILPPLKTQTAIATVLSSIDDKIDLLHRQNHTLEQLAETLFRKWFVEDADESWEERGLDEIADFLNGLACQKYPPKENEIGLPVVKIKEMKTGITDASDYATEDVPEKYILESGDMLFSWSGSLDIELWFGGKAVLNQHLFKVTSSVYPQWFYYFWCKHHLIEFRGIADDKATTMGHIQRKHLSNAKVIVPSTDELKEMSKSAEPLFEKIRTNSHQIRTLTQLRDTLLPKLMSSEVRVE